jgi:hypothetical protein
MRSRFWLGLVDHRDPTITLPDAQVRAMRAENLNAEFARRLHRALDCLRNRVDQNLRICNF